MHKLAIIEGNHSGLVGSKDGAIYGAAEGFADCLSSLSEGLRFEVIRPHFEGFEISKNLFDGCDGIVFTGSANAWSADDEDAAPARDVMALALGAGVPVFGSCYGLQLAVAVLGGRNQAHPHETEFAIARDITINQAGQTHPLFAGKSGRFDARCMHRDEVAELPSGAVSLAANAHSAHQAMVYEQGDVRFWGVQYHPELSFADIAAYIEKNDVASFADAKAFAARLSFSADISEITSDFRALDEEQNDQLIAKYHLNETLLNKAHHRTELRNFLAYL